MGVNLAFICAPRSLGYPKSFPLPSRAQRLKDSGEVQMSMDKNTKAKPKARSTKDAQSSTAITWHHFSAMRMFLATMEPSKTLSQEAIANLLGCTTTNTYSKWERGDQIPPSIVCRAMELLLYYSLVKAGRFKGEKAALEEFFRFKEISAQSSAGLFTRAVDVERKVRNIQLAAYDCMCMMGGHASNFTVATDGYDCNIVSNKIIISPGWNRNGKLAGNALEVISNVAGLVAQDYTSMVTYQNDGSGIPQYLINEYREKGIHYDGVIQTKYFGVKRVKDSMHITFTPEMAVRFNRFLAEAAEIVKAEEAVIPAEADMRDSLRTIVKKMPEAAISEAGIVSLPNLNFTINHCIGSNLRPKTRDINVIEKALCHLLDVDPESITYPAAMVIRNAYGKRATDKSNINTHFFKAAIDGRTLHVQLRRPNALSAINEFLSGVVANEESKRDIDREVALIRGRIGKITSGVALLDDNYHQIVSPTIEISDILSRKGVIRVHLINAMERLLISCLGVNLSHTNMSYSVIRRASNEQHLSRSEAFNNYLTRRVAAEDRAKQEGWSQERLAAEIEQVKSDLKQLSGDVPTVQADCHFFKFDLTGDKALLTFKEQRFIDAINNALASYSPAVTPITDDDEDEEPSE